jgi:hypothetical protein
VNILEYEALPLDTDLNILVFVLDMSISGGRGNISRRNLGVHFKMKKRTWEKMRKKREEKG